MGGVHCPDVHCNLDREKSPFSVIFIEEENSSSRKMSVFPKISLKLEVENYLKAGFMNKEVGQINILDAVCRHSNIYTRGIGKKNLKGN